MGSTYGLDGNWRPHGLDWPHTSIFLWLSVDLLGHHGKLSLDIEGLVGPTAMQPKCVLDPFAFHLVKTDHLPFPESGLEGVGGGFKQPYVGTGHDWRGGGLGYHPIAPPFIVDKAFGVGNDIDSASLQKEAKVVHNE